MKGSEAGESTVSGAVYCPTPVPAPRSRAVSYAPESPEAANSDCPCTAASRKILWNARKSPTSVVSVLLAPVTFNAAKLKISGRPQLVEMLSQVLSVTACANASTYALVVLGAWYTAISANGAIPPDCSTSMEVSPLPPSMAPPPSTGTKLMRLGFVAKPMSDQ